MDAPIMKLDTDVTKKFFFFLLCCLFPRETNLHPVKIIFIFFKAFHHFGN